MLAYTQYSQADRVFFELHVFNPVVLNALKEQYVARLYFKILESDELMMVHVFWMALEK